MPGFSIEGRFTTEYTGWGDHVTVEPPAESEIDPTPDIDEEDLAAYHDAPLLQPVGVPEGWALDGAYVVWAEGGEVACDQAEIDYLDPRDEIQGYLYLAEMAAGCADLEPPPDSTPFVAGSARGWIESYDSEGVFAQIVVGPTVVEIDTDLSAASLARVLAELRPLDLTVEPEPIAGLTLAGTAS